MIKKSAMIWLILLVTLTIIPLTTQAQDGRSFRWERWDMVIDNVDTDINQFDVLESFTIRFTGTYTFGFRNIYTDRVEGLTITDVRVNGISLTQNCSGNASTYCLERSSSSRDFRYYFPEPVTDNVANVDIEYTVNGGIRVYDEYNVINWFAVAQEHAAPVDQSTVVVALPDAL